MEQWKKIKPLKRGAFVVEPQCLYHSRLAIKKSNSPFTLGAVVTRTALTRDGTVVLTKTFPVHTMKNDRASAVSNCRILLTTPT